MEKREPAWRRYARLFGANPRADTDAELEFHYEMRVRDYLRRGLSESEARAAARERLGDVQRVRAECGELGDRYIREDRRREWLGELRQDVKYALRVLRRAPAFTAAAVLTLALGMGATTAIFSVVNRVLLAPLPYPDADRLVNIWEHSPQGEDHNVVSSANYLDWSERARSFSAIGAYYYGVGVALRSAGEPIQAVGAHLTPSAFRALGAAPLLGRTLSPEDGEGDGTIVILSHGLWQQQFGGDRSIIGQTVIVNERAHQVIGVMPASFEFPSADVQLWRPLTTSSLNPTERRSHNYNVLGRLASGVTLDQARAEMAGIARQLGEEHPQFMAGWGVTVLPLHEDLVADVRTLLLVLLGTVAVVLLIACGNLANLLLARAVAREREMAVRGALGAARGRIARQLLTESLIIASAGGLLGVLLARVSVRGLIAAAPANIPLLNQVRLSWPVLAFAAGLVLISTLLFGLAPALRLMHADLQSALRTRREGGTVRDARLRSALLVVQVALSVVLLVGAGLLVRSFAELQRIDLGYRSNDLVVLSLNLPQARYPDSNQHIDFYARLIERLGSVPGVSSVAFTSHAPASGEIMTFSFAIDGRVAGNSSGREDPEALLLVTADYFRTLGIPLVRGRWFTAADRGDAPPVVVISQALARKHWPNEDPVGKRINFRAGELPWMEIVGVVGDARMESPGAEPLPTMYMPHAQKSWNWLSWGSLIARVTPSDHPELLRPQLHAALRELDDRLPVLRFASVNDLYGESMARPVFAMRLVLAFALIALTLCVIGLYGLMAFTVAQQRQDIGVRLALGAQPAAVVRGVLARSLKLALLGLGVGLLTSLLTTRFLAGLLFGVQPADPLTLGAIALLITATALFASWLPAQRAVRTSPLTVLR